MKKPSYLINVSLGWSVSTMPVTFDGHFSPKKQKHIQNSCLPHYTSSKLYLHHLISSGSHLASLFAKLLYTLCLLPSDTTKLTYVINVCDWSNYKVISMPGHTLVCQHISSVTISLHGTIFLRHESNLNIFSWDLLQIISGKAMSMNIISELKNLPDISTVKLRKAPVNIK
jgi:hypothetical protein